MNLIFTVIAFIILNNSAYCLELTKKLLVNQVLVISFDGFSGKKLDEYLKENPNSNFSSFISEGIRAEFIKPSFPSATFPNHYTLVTGLYPESHGIIGNDLYDPIYDTKIELQTAADRLNPKWWDQAEPIWLTAKKQGLKTGTLFWVSSDVNNRNADVWLPYNQAYPFANRINDVINWITKLKLDLTFLYFDEPDTTGHTYGPDTVEYMQKIKELDVLVGSFFFKS